MKTDAQTVLEALQWIEALSDHPESREAAKQALPAAQRLVGAGHPVTGDAIVVCKSAATNVTIRLAPAPFGTIIIQDFVGVPIYKLITHKIREMALERLVEGEKWQPIETAPKDGTYILLWDGKLVTEANYISLTKEREVFVKTTKEGDIYRHEKYEDGYWSPHNTAADWTFSHWMPLPTPPTTREE